MEKGQVVSETKPQKSDSQKTAVKTKASHKKPITKPRNKCLKGRRRQFTNSHLKLFEPQSASRVDGQDEEDTDTEDKTDSKYGHRTLTDNSCRYEVPQEEIGLSESSDSELDQEGTSTSPTSSKVLEFFTQRGLPADLEKDVEELLSLNKSIHQKDNFVINTDRKCENEENFSQWLDNILD